MTLELIPFKYTTAEATGIFLMISLRTGLKVFKIILCPFHGQVLVSKIDRRGGIWTRNLRIAAVFYFVYKPNQIDKGISNTDSS